MQYEEQYDVFCKHFYRKRAEDIKKSADLHRVQELIQQEQVLQIKKMWSDINKLIECNKCLNERINELEREAGIKDFQTNEGAALCGRMNCCNKFLEN